MNHFLDHLSRVEAFAIDPSIQQQAEDFVLRDNPLPVMFSAPHAVACAQGQESETAAGAMALMMAEAGFPAIYTSRNDGNNPDADEASAYRDELVSYMAAEKVAVLFDIHLLPAGSDHEVEIAAGAHAGGRDDITEQLVTQLTEAGLENINVTDQTLDATSVAAFAAHQTSMPCFHLSFDPQFFQEQATQAGPIVEALKKVALYAVAEEARRSQNG